MMQFRREYRLTYPHGTEPQHTWIVEVQQGAMHLHISSYTLEGRREYFGGLETHYRHPPTYMRNTPPSQKHCWVLDCPCWSDGTSLYVSERYIPQYKNNLDEGIFTIADHEGIFRSLERHAVDTFNITDEELNDDRK